MAKLFMRKDLGCLRPCDDAGVATLAKIKRGQDIEVEIRSPRNIMHHRKFWALLNLVFDNQDKYEEPEHLLAALKTSVGHCDFLPGHNGMLVAVPKSIAFHKMDQTAFNEFYDRCIDKIARHFLPGIDSAALRAEVEELIR